MDIEYLQQWISAAQAALGQPLQWRYRREEENYQLQLRLEKSPEQPTESLLASLPLPALDTGVVSETLRQGFLDAEISLVLQPEGGSASEWRSPMSQLWLDAPFAGQLWAADLPEGAAPLRQVQAIRAAIKSGSAHELAGKLTRHFAADDSWQRKNDHGWVGMAVAEGQTPLVRVLLQNRLSPSISYQGSSPLRWALKEENFAAALMLLGAGAAPEELMDDPAAPTLLALAVTTEQQNEGVVQALLAAGADPNRPSGRRRQTPLHLATAPAALTLLIEQGGDVHVTDLEGQTPLHEACRRGNAALIDLLVAAGASLEAENRHGAIPAQLVPEGMDALFDQLEDRRLGPLANPSSSASFKN